LKEIKFSRHAIRRIRLYQIAESVVIDILRKEDASPGRKEIIEHVTGFDLPIKVVFNCHGDVVTVITAYPLKRGML